MELNKFKIVLTQGQNVLVINHQRELDEILEEKKVKKSFDPYKQKLIASFYYKMPKQLESFFMYHKDKQTFVDEKHIDGDVVLLFKKFMSYYLFSVSHGKAMDLNKYGFLVRKLKEFGAKLWLKTQSILKRLGESIGFKFKKEKRQNYQFV